MKLISRLLLLSILLVLAALPVRADTYAILVAPKDSPAYTFAETKAGRRNHLR